MISDQFNIQKKLLHSYSDWELSLKPDKNLKGFWFQKIQHYKLVNKKLKKLIKLVFNNI